MAGEYIRQAKDTVDLLLKIEANQHTTAKNFVEAHKKNLEVLERIANALEKIASKS